MWHQNTQNRKSSFTWRLFTIRNSLWGEKQTWLEWPHLAGGCFWWSCFIRKPPVQNYLFWVVPRVLLLYKFDCSINYIRKQWRTSCKYLLNPHSASVSLNWHSWFWYFWTFSTIIAVSEKKKKKFDISRFIYSQPRFDCFLQSLSSSLIKCLQFQVFYTDFIKLYVIK